MAKPKIKSKRNKSRTPPQNGAAKQQNTPSKNVDNAENLVPHTNFLHIAIGVCIVSLLGILLVLLIQLKSMSNQYFVSQAEIQHKIEQISDLRREADAAKYEIRELERLNGKCQESLNDAQEVVVEVPSNEMQFDSTASMSTEDESEQSVLYPHLNILPYFPDDVYKQQIRTFHISQLNTENFLYNFIFQNTPAVIKQGVSHWPAIKKWTNEYLLKTIGDTEVSVDMSFNNDFHFYGGLYHTETLPFSEFVKCMDHENRNDPLYDWQSTNVSCYLAQHIIEDIFPELKKDIRYPTFTENLRLRNANIWIGPGDQRTPLHYDHGQNLYGIIKGKKTFHLFDPSMSNFLYAISRKNVSSFPLSSQIDLTNVDKRSFPLFKYARKFEVTLEAGDMLYLPAMWWHEVHSYGNPNIGVNFWFDASERFGRAMFGFWEHRIKQASLVFNKDTEMKEAEIRKTLQYPEKIR